MDSRPSPDLLDKHFHAINRTILSRQDPITGLLPASTAINAHGDYTDAWVRDNVYSILSVWGLGLSYRNYDPTHQRSYLLQQSVVKLMRGLLLAMMRQADKVELFKQTQNPYDALHAKYGTATGFTVVGDDEWGHLQLDATSIFLLMLAQMTASGLRIVFTMDEVDFVQNLVHYISHTYSIADYGIWERGNKINHGTTEINGSSVGMAKAALESMDGFNLFGDVRSTEAVIHVIPSDVARSRFTLQGLLPRESNSKETDAALLSVIGYPAYAIEDPELVQRTRNKIIKKLAGNYGCKRFLLDGHQSALEDSSRLHYEPTELETFKHIESEWPLFFTYLLLDAHMRGDQKQIEHWQSKLETLFVQKNGQKLLPELYFVPQELVDAEKQHPGTQLRLPNENIPLVWAQSLYMLSEMITDGVLRAEDIDPLDRRKRIGNLPEVVPLVPVLAENASVKVYLNEQGVESQTLDETGALRIAFASQLSELHTKLGANAKLALSGRPMMVSRTMATSRLHVIKGQQVLFLPYYFNPQGFYLSKDSQLLVEHFGASLQFLSKQWYGTGQPILPLLVRESMCREEPSEGLSALLKEITKGEHASVPIQTGLLQDILPLASIEYFDNVQDVTLDAVNLSAYKKSLRSSSLSHVLPKLESHEIQGKEDLDGYVDTSLVYTLMGENSHLVKTHALEVLWERQGGEFAIMTEEGSLSLSMFADILYETVATEGEWAAARRIAQLTGKYDDRLEDVLLDIIIRHKRLGVGRAYSSDATFTEPHKSTDIVTTIDRFSGSNMAEKVLTQEIILHLGYLIKVEPELFENILTLRSWYFIQLLVGQISRQENLPFGEAYLALLRIAPHDIYSRLRATLKAFTQEVTDFYQQENLNASGTLALNTVEASIVSEAVESDNWATWRVESGMLGPRKATFYKDIWYLLKQCSALVIGDRYRIESRVGSEFTLESTAGERGFALKIDTLLQDIHAPEYRQLTIEALESMSRLFKQNPEFHIENDLILDVLIGHAVKFAWEQRFGGEHYNDKRSEAWETFYKLSPVETDQAFIGALMALIRT